MELAVIRQMVLPAVLICLAFSCHQSHTPEMTGGDKKDTETPEIKALRQQLTAQPDALSERLKLTDLLEEKGWFDEAIAVADQGLALDSTQTVLINRKASLAMTKGDTLAAVEALLRSLRIRQDQMDVLLEIGHVHAARKDARALDVADLVLRNTDKPQWKTAANYLKGLYYTHTDQTQPALAAFDSCIIHDYTFVDAYLEKAILLQEKKEHDKALAVLEKALTVSNTNADAYYWSGRSLAALGRTREAVEAYRKALGLDANLTAAKEALRDLGY